MNKKIGNFLELEEAKIISNRGLTTSILEELLKINQIELTKEEKKLVKKIINCKGFIEVQGMELYELITTYPIQEDTLIQGMLNRYVTSQIVMIFERINDPNNYSLISINKDLKSMYGKEIALNYVEDFDKRMRKFRNKYISHLSIDFDYHDVREIGFNRYDQYIILYLQAKISIYSIIQLFGPDYICLNDFDEYLLTNLNSSNIQNKNKISELYELFNSFDKKYKLS